MSRTTQFIGLTAHAVAFIKETGCVCQPSDTHVVGMFDEKIPLRKWLWTDKDANYVIREFVQEIPWSSGPMIFTCLEIAWTPKSRSLILTWVSDPREEGNEYNYERGTMWV